MSDTKKQLLVLGLGNDVLTDDAIGLLVARELQRELAGEPWVVIRETTEMGLALLDNIVDYAAVFIVDSIQTGKAKPGHVHKLEPSSLKQLTGRTPHFLGIGETLAMGMKLGLPMPDEVKVFAIEVADPFTLGTSISHELQQALPEILQDCRKAITEWRDRP